MVWERMSARQATPQSGHFQLIWRNKNRGYEPWVKKLQPTCADRAAKPDLLRNLINAKDRVQIRGKPPPPWNNRTVTNLPWSGLPFLPVQAPISLKFRGTVRFIESPILFFYNLPGSGLPVLPVQAPISLKFRGTCIPL